LAQGIVDTRWLFFHVAIISILLVFAVVVINPRAKLNQWLKASLFAITMVHLSIFAGRHSHRGDWTSGQVYTLSERAREIIASLTIPVDVTVIIPTALGEGRQNPVLAELREVLFRMAEVNPLLRIRFLD